MENSPLATLPAELRVNIYEYTLYRTGGITLVWDSTGRKLVLSTTSGSEEMPADTQLTALMSTCRHINAECDRILFKVNTFVLDCSRISLRDIVYAVSVNKLFDTLGSSNVAVVGAVTIDFGTFTATNSDETHRWVVEKFTWVIPKLRLWAEKNVPVIIKLWVVAGFPCKHGLWIDCSDLENLKASYYAAVAKVNQQRVQCGDTSHTSIFNEHTRCRNAGEFQTRYPVPAIHLS